MCVFFLLSAGNVRLCKVDTTNIYIYAIYKSIYYDIYIYIQGVCVHRNMYARTGQKAPENAVNFEGAPSKFYGRLRHMDGCDTLYL